MRLCNLCIGLIFLRICVLQGKADNLGGGVYKKRLNQNRDRAIVLAKGGEHWFYTFLYA
ncbi:type II toxin-antitoxin system RelE/ParE family toxin, partial [Salmonella enterica subsp. enterica serovar Kentucky]|nr:type II toxin-antitoxin system RelE/ParE family toxin [Salmonella enterica subsp. enterica serovar Kentucky]